MTKKVAIAKWCCAALVSWATVFSLQANASDGRLPARLIYSAPAQPSDSVGDIKADSAGNIVVGGISFQPTFRSWDQDAVITRLGPNGNELSSRRLGGQGYEESPILGIDGSGNIYVVGTTYSVDFPGTNAAQATFAGPRELYLTKLAPDGTQLLFSTFLGGSDDEWITGMAVDNDGNAAICGHTRSTNFPGVCAPAAGTNSNLYRPFVTLFSPTGQIIFSRCIGEAGADYVAAVAFAPAGNLVVVGRSTSNAAGTPRSVQSTNAGGGDLFIMGLSGNGSVQFFSYLGGSDDDTATSVAVDNIGDIYVGGTTSSTNFPASTVIGHFPTAFPSQNWQSFIVKLNGTASQVRYATLFKSLWDIDQLFVDSEGNAIIGSFYGAAPPRVAWLAPDGQYFTDAQGIGSEQRLRMTPGPDRSIYVAGVRCIALELHGSYLGCRASALSLWRGEWMPSATSNSPPVVTIQADPSTRIVAGSNVTFSASAEDLDGSVEQVAFYYGGALIGSFTTPPYTLTLTNVPAGTNDVWVAATDDKGAIGLSQTLRLIAVNSPGNDHYENAFEITGTNTTATGTIAGATSESFDYVSTPTIWWRWTAPVDGVFTASAFANGFAAGLDLFGTGSSNSLQVLFHGMNYGTVAGQQISFSATAGQSYLFRVYDRSQYAGRAVILLDDYDVSLSIRLANLSPNSNPTNAFELVGQTVRTNVVVLDSVSDSTYPSSSVWFSWTAPSSGPYAIAILGNEDYLWSYVTIGHSPDGPYKVAGFTRLSASNRMEGIVLEAEAGHRYFLPVQSQYYIEEGLVLSISPVARPGNDNFANRILISGVPVTATGSNIGASGEAGEPLLPNRFYLDPFEQNSVWWEWAAPEDGAYRVSAVPATDVPGPAQPYNGYFRFGVFAGNVVSNLEAVSVSSPNPSGSIKFKAVAGSSYPIDVDTAGRETDFRVLIERIDPPGNDDLAEAAIFHGSSVSGTLQNATYEPVEPGAVDGNAGSVWWKWTAPDDRIYSISVSNAFQYGGLLAALVYSGSGFADFTVIASNNATRFLPPGRPFPPNPAPTNALLPNGWFKAEAGRTYYFAVVGNEPSAYALDFQLWLQPGPRLEIVRANSDVWLRFTVPIGKTNVIEASTDLLQWLPVSTNVNVNGTVWFADPDLRNFDRRFYRLRSWP